jgi:hypothetical protein
MDFTAKDKEEVSFTEKFPYGVHQVVITGFDIKKADNGNEFVEVGFANMDGTIEDKCRVYFTEKARLYSFNTMRQIYVHNAPSDKKELARKQVDAVPNLDNLVELMGSKKSLQAWVTKYQDPTRTYLGSDGRTYKSTNISIMGYEPKLNESLMPKPQEGVNQAASAVFSFEVKDTKDEPFPSTGPVNEGWV